MSLIKLFIVYLMMWGFALHIWVIWALLLHGVPDFIAALWRSR